MSATLQRIGDSYFLSWGQGVIFEFHHLKDHGEGLAAELSITQEGFLAHWGRLTLSSSIARTTAVKAASEAKPGYPWRKMVDESCHQVQALHRQGVPATPLEPKAPEPGQWLVDGLVPAGETTIVFGDGGTGKSLFALAFAVCGLLGHPLGAWRVGSVRKALYLDWESSRRDHETRLWGLLGPLEPLPPEAILYRPMVRPVAEEAAELRALVAKHQIDLVICDSLGPACGADPETAGAATAAMTALRSCAPATRLVVAHVSKSEADRQYGTSRPFGSVYVANLARSVIEAKRADSTDEQEFTLTLTHTKSNTGPRKPQSAVRWLFDPEGYIGMMKGEPDLARASIGTQTLAVCRSGAKTVAELAETLGVPASQIRAELHRLEKRGKVIQLATVSGGRGHKGLWGLVEKTVAPPDHKP